MATCVMAEVGERLLGQLRPALHGIAAALTDVGRLREKPAGLVRLIAPPVVLATLLSSRPSAKPWPCGYGASCHPLRRFPSSASILCSIASSMG
jgi:hypothetical protein